MAKNRARKPGDGKMARLEKTLLVLLPCLSLALAALVLVPAVRTYQERYRAAQAILLTPAEEEALRLRLFPPVTPEPLYLGDPFFGWKQEGDDLYYRDNSGNNLTGLRRIDGKLYYFLPDGRKAGALGVDVSFYNEDIDWREVKAQGIDFAIVRLGGRGWGGGVLYGDIRTEQYLHNACEAGLRVGAYFYSTAGSEREAAEEARAALRTLGGAPLELPVFIDVEESGEYPKGRADTLSREERTKVVQAFCRVIEAAGYEAGVYSGHYFYNYALNAPALRGRTLWLANYSDAAANRLPSFGGDYAIWQFTDRAQVKGITGYTDLNVMF